MTGQGLTAAFAVLLCVVGSGQAPAQTYVWHEAETPDQCNFEPNIEHGPRGELMSGGAWLQASLSEQQVAAGELGDGRRLSYRLEVPEAGSYRLWIRLAYEFARAPLSWRLDDLEWHEIPPSDLTTNLIEMGEWCELGWMDCGLGRRRAGMPVLLELGGGTHSLQIRATEPGEDGRFLMALDCFALVQGDWMPDAALRPGERPQTPLDQAAATHVFRFPSEQRTPGPGKRAELSLSGPWQVCRHDDPDMDVGPYEPVRDMPAQPVWRGIEVPSGLRDTPALDMAHRVWYRCRVDVPAEMAGRSFYLDFTGTNWIASVVVNDRLVGWHKSTRVPWKLDITSAIRPGEVNEMRVGIKDLWYGIDAQFRQKTLDEMRNVPPMAFQWTRFVAPFYPSTKGDADGTVCGITDPVSLIVCGSTYVQDCFVQTSVGEQQATVELTVRNSSDDDAPVSVGAEAVYAGDGQVEESFEPVELTVAAGATQQVTLAADWPDAKLWWPDQDPAHMYRLRTTVRRGGEVLDIAEQLFGFREVRIDGIYLRINGVRRNFWNMLAGLEGRTPEERLAHFRAGSNRFERFSEDLGLREALGPRRSRLAWFDAHGVAGRLSTMIDGMFINYDLSKPVVWENFREHCEQVALAYRNHPSIIVYSLENELVLINGRLGYAGILDEVEGQARTLADVVHELDPTRPCMLDGAGALADNSLEINCLHYPEADQQFYPENAFTMERWGSFGERWVWDRQRPVAMGEIAFFAGKNSQQAWVGGDEVFRGREEALHAGAKYVRTLIEAYRWNDVCMICPWVAADRMPETRLSMSPLAAFVREYGPNFLGDRLTPRTVKVFNDTYSADPVTFSWGVQIGDQTVAGEERTLPIEPGFGEELTIGVTGPPVAERTPARLVLRVSQPGNESTFEDIKEIAFFPQTPRLNVARRVAVLEADSRIANTLAAWGVQAHPVRAVPEVGAPDGILIVGPDYLSTEQAPSPALAEYARGGGRVICLEQDHPLQGQSLPTEVTATDRQAYYAFPQGLGTPLLGGLGPDDLCNWSGPGPTAKHVWEKPSGAARSWIECGDELNYSAMLEVPCGEGVMLLLQMCVGAKLEEEPAAGVLLANAIRYCDTYAPPTAPCGLYAPDRPDIARAIEELGVAVRQVERLEGGLDYSTSPVLVVSASGADLQALLGEREAAEAFTEQGGWIMLWGLEPDGLSAYNELLGTEHLLRQFRLEKVVLEPDPVVAGLGNRDVVMYSDRELLHGDMWLSRDVFTYVVDGADIAPFCHLPNQPEGPYEPTYDDHDPFNLVNGMTGHEFWRYILQIWTADWPAEGSPPFVFGLPHPIRVNKVRVWNNAYYDTIEDLEIQLDGRRAATMVLPDAMAMAEADLGGARATESVGLVVRSIRDKHEQPLVGFDNVQIIRELPDWYVGRVKPLVNCGGLVKYPRGKGGFILNQLKLTDEDLPENKAKKARAVAAILQNLGVAFRGES